MKIADAIDKCGAARKRRKRNGVEIGILQKENGKYSIYMRSRARRGLKMLYDDLTLEEVITKCGEDNWEAGYA